MKSQKKSKTVVNVGIDVGKQTLDIYLYEKGLHWQEDNTAEGIKRILKRLAHYQVERLVMEATGRYEFGLAEAPMPRGCPCALLNLWPSAAMQGPLARPPKPTSWMRR